MFGKISPHLVAAGLLTPALVGQAPWLHNPRGRLPHSQGPAIACRAVDLNGDGLLDLVRASGDDFGVFLQDKGGRYAAAGVSNVRVTGSVIAAVATGAIVTGKLPDIVVGYRNGQVLVFPNAGGSFGSPWVLPKITGSLNPTVAGVHAGDLDGNGIAEIVLTLNLETPVVFTVSGSKTFSQARLSGPSLRVPRAALADLDGDKDLDLVCMTGDGAAAAYPGLYLNNGRGALVYDVSAFAKSTRVAAAHVLAAQVLGTTRTELVVALPGANAAPVRIFRNTASGSTSLKYSLFATTSVFTITNPADFAVADANGDRLPDLFAIDANGAVVCGLNNPKAPGAFLAAHTLLEAAPRGRLCVADLEGDGDTDVIASGAGIEDSLLLGAGSAATLKVQDTEARDMPIGRLDRPLFAAVDVTGEGDPDLVAWDRTGRPALLHNVEGQARFERIANSKVPQLPAGTYTGVQQAPISRADARDLVVYGPVSVTNTTGVRIIVRAPTGQLFDETSTRWTASVRLSSLTVADVVGRVTGSSGAAGFADVVGLDSANRLVLVVNAKGKFGKAVVLSNRAAAVGSEILVGDLNLDKLQDLVVLQPGGVVRVLLANPKVADTFNEGTAVAAAASTGILTDVTGDLLPDLVLSVPTAKSRVLLFAGLGTGGFQDRTSKLLPRIGTQLDRVTSIAAIRAAHTNMKSIVLGFAGVPDVILRPAAWVFGAPETLPLRGSVNTRSLIVSDLDLDGDDDLVVVRFDTYPALLLGQSWQFDNVGGYAQLGREALVRVALPNSRTFAAIGIGYPTIRFALPGLGVIRLARMSVILPMPSPSAKLEHHVRVAVPTGIGLTPIPMQLFSIQTATGQLSFRNLDLFRPTDR